jgi:hypothetical protein
MVGSALYIGGDPLGRRSLGEGGYTPPGFRKLRVRTLRLLQRHIGGGPCYRPVKM